jgi:hypothetical protein
MKNSNFPWDEYSDQPYPIKDKNYKKQMYKKGALDMLLTLLTTLFLSPFIALRYLFLQNKHPDTHTIFGMGVNADKLPEISPALIDELGLNRLLIRIPLCDMQNLQNYLEFVKRFENKHITLNILQDRFHVENLESTKDDVARILEQFAPYTQAVQIGNAINRKKWGFASMYEYMRFYSTIAPLKKRYPHIDFIGSSTIDFEYHYTVATLFNTFFPRYDKVSSLLYVDRRGAPENTQMGFDFIKKIKLLYAIVSLSPSKNKIVISEFNWPITNTAPFAPTSEKECVSEKVYADYMVRSYLLALSTGMVETIYWHQLVASGYGLIDAREGTRKREAFFAYKFMVQMLQGATLKSYDFGTIYTMQFQKEDKIIEVFWAKKPTKIKIQGKLYDIVGNEIEHYFVDERVVYKESNR